MDSTGMDPVGDVLRLFGADESIVSVRMGSLCHGCHVVV